MMRTSVLRVLALLMVPSLANAASLLFGYTIAAGSGCSPCSVPPEPSWSAETGQFVGPFHQYLSPILIQDYRASDINHVFVIDSGPTFDTLARLWTNGVNDGIYIQSGGGGLSGLESDIFNYYAADSEVTLIGPDLVGFAITSIGIKVLDARVYLDGDFVWNRSAVRWSIYGDLAPIPLPATFYLFGSALGLMGGMRRKATM